MTEDKEVAAEEALPEIPPPEALMPPPSALRVSFSTAAVLLVFTVLFTGLMAGAYLTTKPVIEASAQAEKLRLVTEVLPAAEFDNAPLEDFVEVPALDALGGKGPTRIYRARRAGQPAGLIFEAATDHGYGGTVRLLLALRADGRLAGVRVVDHRETPGLGDYIDIRKDKRKTDPWVRQFDDRAFDAATAGDWHVKKDGGAIDARAGATISARAVTDAVAKALAFAVPRRDALFAAAHGSRWLPPAGE